ncbi:MAG: hypothetical protein JJT81_17060 [Rubellimicrobium sp.]|nr:hypothetical protein [Rubellimicrobium sp.]
MHDATGLIATLSRPRLLVSAARFGVDDYRRAPHLPRLLETVALPRSGEAILRLLDIEDDLNTRRVAVSADYAVGRHVEVLIALLGEARLLRSATRPAPDPAPGFETMQRPIVTAAPVARLAPCIT